MYMYEGGFAKKKMILLHLLHHKQMYVTPVPFDLLNPNKDFELLMARQIRWCATFVVLKLGLMAHLSQLIFSCGMSNFIKFGFYQCICGFLLRQSHITVIYSNRTATY